MSSASALLEALGPAPSDGRALILIGGADAVEPERDGALRNLFDRLARLAERTRTTIVDGGTDSGVMRLIGEARAAMGGSFRLVGIAPAGAFERTTRDGAPIVPASGHSELLAVPGDQFGDETALLFQAADHLGSGGASTMVVNGGRLALEEARRRLTAGHVVVAVEGSGRAADELAADGALRSSGRLRVVPLTVDDAGLAAAIDGRAEQHEGPER